MELIKITVSLTLTLLVGYGIYKGILTLTFRRGRVMIIPVEELRRRTVQRDVHDPVWPYESRSR